MVLDRHTLVERMESRMAKPQNQKGHRGPIFCRRHSIRPGRALDAPNATDAGAHNDVCSVSHNRVLNFVKGSVVDSEQSFVSEIDTLHRKTGIWLQKKKSLQHGLLGPEQHQCVNGWHVLDVCNISAVDPTGKHFIYHLSCNLFKPAVGEGCF